MNSYEKTYYILATLLIAPHQDHGTVGHDR